MNGPKTKPLEWPFPRRGQIVLCCFPYEEEPNVPGEKRRPAVVLDVDPAGNRLLVCYGSGQAGKSVSAVECLVDDHRHLQALHLDERTVFDFSKTRWLSYTREWFAVPRGVQVHTPFLGSMQKCSALKPKVFAAMRAAGLEHLLPATMRRTAASTQTAPATE